MGTPLHVVTGAFGYSGSYIASRLLDSGVRVRTITNSLSRPSPLQGRIEAHPFNFDRPERLVESLRGASVLYNTYWVRFNATGFRHSVAVENSLTLFRAAKEAGVQRVVHVSITNPFLPSSGTASGGHSATSSVTWSSRGPKSRVSWLTSSSSTLRRRVRQGSRPGQGPTRPPSASTIPVRWSGGVTAEANIAREPDPPCAPSCVDSLAPAGVSS